MSNPLAATVDTVLFASTSEATTTIAGTVDCQDAMFAQIIVTCSIETNTDNTGPVVTIQESDDTVVTNFATFDADHARTIDNTATAVGSFAVDCRGRKRYLRCLVTPDTTTNGLVGMHAVGQVLKIHDAAIAATKTV